ncbi:carboxyl-terminal processing protease [Lactobacillus colini]|uniref:Carboxyl-terminal processing protease n=1 Tax=Lactobacillus colini TaxID=1819254 RepID=A0ABS4MF44_9LACO|nr:S41 family peptidase [Lactobacillus colini]MBP2057992.1 carboxyl-terminal processing protease [Lactobacillus colini]
MTQSNKKIEDKTASKIKKKFKLPKIAQFTLTALVSLAIGSGVTYGVIKYQQDSSPLAEIAQVYNQLQSTYYKAVSSKQLSQGAVNGMINSLNDPYSQTLTGQSQQQINSLVEGASFGGVGIQMTVKNNRILVDSIVAGSPASKSNIKVGDEILSVDRKKVTAKHFNKVAELVRGKKGTKVTLQLERNKIKFKVTLIRAEISQSNLTVKTQGKATIITISQFDVDTGKNLKAALKEINPKKTPKLIIDLQDNPGGVMNSALEAASYFVPNGKILMRYQSRDGQEIIKSSKKLSGGYKTTLRPIILINNQTASASEIFTAALVENKCAISVGQTSYGKGTVQQVGSSDNVEYKYTVAKWLTPNGTWINHKGIKPTFKAKESKFEQLPQFQSDQTLKKNMMGLNVAILQQYLTALGYLQNNITGVYDNPTQIAVNKFKEAQGLTVDGKVTASTMQALYFVVSQKATQSNPALKKALSLKI